MRTGGAEGSDDAFESGCDAWFGQKELYLPWDGAFGRRSPQFSLTPALAESIYRHPSYKVVRRITPAGFENMFDSTKRKILRDVLEILGLTLDRPADRVICWTPTLERPTGGTKYALALAEHYGIPVLNLQDDDLYAQAVTYIRERR